MEKELTVLVNTSDSFEDCWEPFFTLFKRYWPNCPFPIVLNTELKGFELDGLNISCSKVAEGETRRLTWSECLARCLDKIDTPYILYFQEDYFLEEPVKEEYIHEFLNEMREGRADVIRLMELGGSGPWQPTENKLLWRVAKSSRYLLGLQAGLWRKSTMQSHIRLHENPWQFEIFGSFRARRKNDIILCVNRDLFTQPGAAVLPYRATGVVAGKWQKHIVEPLFAAHGLTVDFAKRGFYDPAVKKKKANIIKRIMGRMRSLY
ncbi:hypothetical protein [Methylomonas sp. UP202]|uniref:hypothetical protein n=1 Tax=Methylomonas sp. UP202 TaxID=3040943 RepID=UPI0024799E42|nr:hypothetical protein [Methylomonas sp. UP202]WGS86790.1 hypothetical protein QC632_03285 [Methylomonas sp. UP202]